MTEFLRSWERPRIRSTHLWANGMVKRDRLENNEF
jgi:hypothetical protein